MQKKRLTPVELFNHRLASLLGRSVAEMKSGLTQREYLSWQRYWIEEPWGPWRDNLHAALLAREVIRPHAKAGVKIELEDFMVRQPEDVQRSKRTAAILRLAAVATKVQS